MEHKGKKTGKARIPDHLRRRALVSCDRCKKRRIRCLRNNGSDANEACQSCLEVGVNCESTLPRKTRIYGSVETLSVRYRVLDALIKGLYPDKDTNNIETLYAIAEAHDVSIPTFDEQTVAEEVFNTSAPPKPAATSPQHSGASPSAASRDSENSSVQDGAVIIEEKLVPMPNHGPSHYIGPSSSFGFVLVVRNMVAEFNAALRTVQPEDERTRIAGEFGGSNWSKALEPIVKEESDESSEDGVDRSLDQRINQGRFPQRKMHRFSVFQADGHLTSRFKKATILSLLPTKEVTDTFLDAFFDKVHPNYLVFHRPTFQARYEATWQNPHVLMRDVEPGWVCSIFMTLVFGAQCLEDRDPKQSKQIQKHYLDLVQARMHQLISATTLVNVQALLLLQLYQHNNTERNSAFMLLGCASRMAMALGMHREGSSGGFDAMEREVRKRVWWTAYSFEQYQCAILGRPCAIEDSEVNVTFADEIMLDGGASVPSGYVDHSIRLTRLLSEIRRKIYASPNSPDQQGASPKNGMAVQFLLDLDTWHNGLPPTLRLETLSSVPKHRRAVLLLHIQFHHIQSLVTRPFILRKVGVQLARKLGRHVRSQDLDKEELALSQACGTFCRKATLLLHQLLVTSQFDGVAWIDAYYIYHSVFILALDFLARPWDEQDTPEDASRKKAVRDVMDALKTVKLCATFKILTGVSLQLAKIVSIFEVASQENPVPAANAAATAAAAAAAAAAYLAQPLPYTGLQPPPVPQPQPHLPGNYIVDYGTQAPPSAGPGGGSSSNNVMHTWFQKGPTDIPWDLKDFFGTDSYVGAPDPSTSMAGVTLGGLYNPGVVDEDIVAQGVPPHTAYTQWRQIDTPFAQQPQPLPPHRNMPPGPPMV